MSNIDTVEEGISQVQLPEQATEVPFNLIDAVTTMLTEAGVYDPEAWKIGLEAEALTNPDTGVQRFLVNRHWRIAFTSCAPDKTMNARGCLVQHWDISDWLKRFREVVIPCAIEIGMLKKIDLASSNTESSSSAAEAGTTQSSSDSV